MQTKAEKFVHFVTETDLLWHRLADISMKQYNLKGCYAIYLSKLMLSEDGLTATQLGSLCGRDKADAAREISILTDKGLIARKAGGNRYRAKLTLTDKGREVADYLIAQAADFVIMVSSGLPEEDRATFYRVLDIINQNLQTTCAIQQQKECENGNTDSD